LVGSSLVGPDSINREFWGEGEVQFCGVSSQQTTTITNSGDVGNHPIWLHLLLGPDFLTREFWVRVKCNSVECLHNKQQQSQNWEASINSLGASFFLTCGIAGAGVLRLEPLQSW